MPSVTPLSSSLFPCARDDRTTCPGPSARRESLWRVKSHLRRALTGSAKEVRVGRGFVVRFVRVDVLPSARRHGIQDADIDHAVRHATVVDEVGEDPLRFLLIGPDRSGNLLEMIVLDRPQGPAVIHAMALRAKYRQLLPPGGQP